MWRAELVLALLALLLRPGCGYYLPGTFPQAYPKGAMLQAEVNSVTSFKTELPFDYYSLPFCKPANGVTKSFNVNIGTLLTGQKIQNSPYNFTMLQDQRAASACGDKGFYGPLAKKEVKNLVKKIKDSYRARMILDNLPATTQDLEQEEGSVVRTGFELGYEIGGHYFINNHLIFTVLVHEMPPMYSNGDLFRPGGAFDIEGRRRLLEEDPTSTLPHYTVVGFEVKACSINRSPDEPVGSDMVCIGDGNIEAVEAAATGFELKEGRNIPYTYDVHWKVSDTEWASRWDAYLQMPRGQVHWFSIINSIIVVVVLTGVVMIILLRTVRRDLVKYEELLGDTEGEFSEEYGWKLVMGDVFRLPPAPVQLCVQVGTGVHILLCLFATTVFAALGFLSPAARGALLSTCIGIYILASTVGGYVSVRMAGQLFQSHEKWVHVALRTCFFFPGIVVLFLTIVNILLSHTGTSGAIPFKAYFTILVLWWLVSVPLGMLGGFVASKTTIYPFPARTNQIPRQIPEQKVHSFVYFLGSGLLVFGNIFIVLYFTMTSMWQGYFYYLFGFVLIAGVLTCIITAQVSVVATYLQLCTEDYRWWWTSFARGGAVAAYVAVYAIAFLSSTLSHIHGFLSVTVYLAYMMIFSYGLFLMMGSLGFLASFYFTYSIFASVKSD